MSTDTETQTDTGPRATSLFGRLHEHRSAFALMAIVIVSILLAQTTELNQGLKYVRVDLFDKPWTALTHSFTHVNQYQLLASMCWLGICFTLFRSAFISLWWSAALAVSSVCAALGMYYYAPTLAWSSGMTGALHGLFVYTALRSRASYWWILLLVVKLLFEKHGLFDALPVLASLEPDFYRFFSTSALVGNPLVYNANLWGAAGGLFFYFIVRGAATLLVFVTIARSE